MKDEKRIEKPRKPSSPRTHHMPDLIPDTPENIARALLNPSGQKTRTPSRSAVCTFPRAA